MSLSQCGRMIGFCDYHLNVLLDIVIQFAFKQEVVFKHQNLDINRNSMLFGHWMLVVLILLSSCILHMNDDTNNLMKLIFILEVDGEYCNFSFKSYL